MGYRRVPPIFVSEDRAVLAYIAGIIDGEGTINVCRHFGKGSVSFAYSIRVTVVNTDIRLIEWLQSALKTDVQGLSHRREDKPTWKPRRWLQFSGKNAEALLTAVMPFLVIKKEQAELALKMREFRRAEWRGRAVKAEINEQREALRHQIMTLNRRGVVPAA